MAGQMPARISLPHAGGAIAGDIRDPPPRILSAIESTSSRVSSGASGTGRGRVGCTRPDPNSGAVCSRICLAADIQPRRPLIINFRGRVSITGMSPHRFRWATEGQGALMWRKRRTATVAREGIGGTRAVSSLPTYARSLAISARVCAVTLPPIVGA